MRLPNDIRNLPHRKRLHRDRTLKWACHEAAHTMYALRHGINFLEVRVGRETIDANPNSDDLNCKSVDITGRLVPDPNYEYYRSSIYPTGHGWDDAAKLSLAGHAFEQIVDPHHSDLCLMFMGSANDYRQALEFVKWGLFVEEGDADGREAERTIDNVLIPAVRKFLLENWESVIALGEILNERKMLTAEEVKQAVQ
jgi:hypothetical protein